MRKVEEGKAREERKDDKKKNKGEERYERK